MRLTIVLTLLLAALLCEAGEAPQPINLVEPQDHALFDDDIATMVVKVDTEKVDNITIVLDNNTTHRLAVAAPRDTYCKSITLHQALNTVTITTTFRDKTVQRSAFTFYYMPELYEGIDEKPEIYQVHFFHSSEKEKKCVACHDMNNNIPTGDNVFEDVTQTTCYSCHQRMLATRNTHAPAANWLCTNCHDGKAGEYNMESAGTSKYLVADPVDRTCQKCHEDVEKWEMSGNSHGAVNDGRCERCHNPHGSDHEFFLRKSIWDLCTTCHAEKATGAHILASYVFGRNDGAHPTKGKSDPSRIGRELTCSSCHNPHGSQGKYLLRMKGSMPFNVCQRCHQK